MARRGRRAPHLLDLPAARMDPIARLLRTTALVTAPCAIPALTARCPHAQAYEESRTPAEKAAFKRALEETMSVRARDPRTITRPSV